MFQMPMLVSPVSPSPGQGMPWEYQVTHETQIPPSPHTVNPATFPGWAGCLFHLSLELTCQWVRQVSSPSQVGDLQPTSAVQQKVTPVLLQKTVPSIPAYP